MLVEYNEFDSTKKAFKHCIKVNAAINLLERRLKYGASK